MEEHHGDYPDDDICAEIVLGTYGQHAGADDQHRVEHDDDHGTDKPEGLGGDGEYKVVLPLRDEAELAHGACEAKRPLPVNLARPDGEARLSDVVGLVGGRDNPGSRR